MRDGAHVIISIPKGRVQATCIHVWRRGDGSQWIMSISSGPKDCLVNCALHLFDAHPKVQAVALMSLPGPSMLFLLEVDEVWRDILGLAPRIEEAA